MPRRMGLELARSLQYTNRANGILRKVAFCKGLDEEDCIRICTALQPQRYTLPRQQKDADSQPTGELDRNDFIMATGTRGTEMWIVHDGHVRIEDKQSRNLGQLGTCDIFGDKALLLDEQPGVHLKYEFSAFAISTNVTVLSLSRSALWALRNGSHDIDLCVRRASHSLKGGDESLHVPEDDTLTALNQRMAEMQDQQDELNAKMDNVITMLRRLEKA